MDIRKRDIIVDTIFVVVLVVSLVACVICYMVAHAEPVKATHQPTTSSVTEEIVEPMKESIETEIVEAEPPVALYDVPLDADLQIHIIETAASYGIDPAIIMAMAYKESTYRTDAIGDGGNSLGLLQVQPRWHGARMERLGCPNLLDPYQNATVAIDYLAEQIDRYDDLSKGLVAYNRGHYAGTVTEYAKTVLAKAEELAVM